jgi:hypothetical protein
MVVLAAILLILSGIAKAVKDTIEFHFFESVFKNLPEEYWNPYLSHLNKYKNLDPQQGARFFGSTTFLVWITDAWHLFQMIEGVSLASGFFIIGSYYNWIYAIIGYALTKSVFELFWSKIFNKK